MLCHKNTSGIYNQTKPFENCLKIQIYEFNCGQISCLCRRRYESFSICLTIKLLNGSLMSRDLSITSVLTFQNTYLRSNIYDCI